ncbi:hypothetical protein BVC80_1575g13 [Macleaya cordata]|uniref:Uncharacterized protein n=1 Tax=Macleaya cordata TaxID=56857 RepID=A0A200QPE5_MACCD|nr:hypothetical protein BVC80_1575g13 [Macleaya cordata]
MADKEPGHEIEDTTDEESSNTEQEESASEYEELTSDEDKEAMESEDDDDENEPDNPFKDYDSDGCSIEQEEDEVVVFVVYLGKLKLHQTAEVGAINCDPLISLEQRIAIKPPLVVIGMKSLVGLHYLDRALQPPP